MDEASLREMAARVASGSAPDPDPLYEVSDLASGCREAVGALARDYSEGRVSEEAFLSLSRSVGEAARTACDLLRSRKKLVESVLSGRIGVTA